VAFRGGIVQAVGSWIHSPLVAFAVTTVISTALFVAAHGSMDPWIWIDIGSLGVAGCYLAWRTGGIEAAIALHVVNNVLITLQGIVFGGLDQSYVDTETTGSISGSLMSVAVMSIATGLLLWAARRRGIALKGWLTPAKG
jgi:membrane protease YdiL (CAAX protease family)